jgi:hypothetical protein
MGLFDAFRKKPAGAAQADAPGGLLGALIQRYKLEQAAPPPGSALTGSWWEQPPNDDLLVAFQARGADLAAFLGEPAEITEIYLVRDASGGFRLGAGNEMDFPELRRPEFTAALAKLTASVKEFQAYETRDGVSLLLAPTATPETVAQDLETARALLYAVEKK